MFRHLVGDAGAASKVIDDFSEIGAARDESVIDVGGPGSRLAPIDEKASGRLTMGDNSIGAHPQDAVRHVLVRRDPTARVALPPELGEGRVQMGCERGQDGLQVEVPDPCLSLWGRHLPHSL